MLLGATVCDNREVPDQPVHHDFCCPITESLDTIEYKPAHDKTYKMACAPSEDSDQPGHLQSDQSSL